MLRKFSYNDMIAEQKRASLYCEHFNSWLSGCGLAAMLVEGQWTMNPPVQICMPNVGMGEEYQNAFTAWLKNGAVTNLVKACDIDEHRFTFGSFGSIWMDVSLTGMLPDSTLKTKQVRIALVVKNPPVLAGMTQAVRVVGDKAEVVNVKAQTNSRGVWVLACGEHVPQHELYPIGKLTDDMNYLMMIDPTIDLMETF